MSDKLPVSRQFITPTCRANRGNDGAIDEALRRVRDAYLNHVGVPSNEDVEWHITLYRVEASHDQ